MSRAFRDLGIHVEYDATTQTWHATVPPVAAIPGSEGGEGTSSVPTVAGQGLAVDAAILDRRLRNLRRPYVDEDLGWG